MGQDISLKIVKGKTHDLNHDLTFSAHTISCVCHSIRSMFRVLGICNLGGRVTIADLSLAGAAGALAPPDFRRFVNPNPTSGVRLCPTQYC